MTDVQVIHILPGGRKVVTVRVLGSDGFIATYMGADENIYFGHGITRNEAVNEVAEKIGVKEGTRTA